MNNMYVRVGEEVDYKRVVLEFDRYLKETKLLYSRNGVAVFDDVKEVWKEIISGEFLFMD